MAGESRRRSRELAVNCPSCGFPNTAAARFCGGCGRRLNAQPNPMPEAEHRHVCVLFCDLVGSTPLSHRLDPEDMRRVVGAYQHACEEVVLRHDGFVAQYRGDSIEVYFGYPRAHEDDPARVVRCALDMLAAVRQVGESTAVDLQVRIGIDCGQVVVGTLEGSGRPERVAVGETPNIAARVQSEAAPGEVVLSDSLWRLLPAALATEPLGARKLKGVERPVALFRVVTGAAKASAGQSVPKTPFVGRASEWNVLEAEWAKVKTGVTRFVIVRGEPGIGKSRLVEEFRRGLERPEIDVLEIRCTPDSQDSAFLAVIELVERRLGLDRSISADAQLDRIDNRLIERGITAGDAAPLLADLLSIPAAGSLPAAGHLANPTPCPDSGNPHSLGESRSGAAADHPRGGGSPLGGSLHPRIAATAPGISSSTAAARHLHGTPGTSSGVGKLCQRRQPRTVTPRQRRRRGNGPFRGAQQGSAGRGASPDRSAQRGRGPDRRGGYARRDRLRHTHGARPLVGAQRPASFQPGSGEP